MQTNTERLFSSIVPMHDSHARAIQIYHVLADMGHNSLPTTRGGAIISIGTPQAPAGMMGAAQFVKLLVKHRHAEGVDLLPDGEGETTRKFLATLRKTYRESRNTELIAHTQYPSWPAANMHMTGWDL